MPGEDLERNDGSEDRPYYMSPELHEILTKSDGQLRQEEEEEPDKPDPPPPLDSEEIQLQQQQQCARSPDVQEAQGKPEV